MKVSSVGGRSPSVRDCWPTEAGHFTPWLADPANLQSLSDLLGCHLLPEARELRVGRYTADLVCRLRDDGARAVIENQLERSDHDHLGKLCTYAGQLQGVRLLIWIAPVFTTEHLKALALLDALNDDHRFVAVQIACGSDPSGGLAAEFSIATATEGHRATRVSTTPGLRWSDPEGRDWIEQPALRGARRPNHEYGHPERLAFLAGFLEWSQRSGLAWAGDLSFSGPSETPPFVWRNLGKGSIKLKGKVTSLQTLQAEVLVRRFQGRDRNYDAYFAELQTAVESMRPRHRDLDGLTSTADRERRILVARDFDEEINGPGDGEKFRWLGAAMDHLYHRLMPVIEQLDAAIGR